jgi:cytochrome c peroxidase
MKKAIITGCVLWFMIASFRRDKHATIRIPEGWPAPTYDFSKNPLSKEKILLGRALFFDPILSADSTISCTSCHLQYTAFTHVDHALSHGIAGKIGTRNSPALTNLAWGKLLMWDGAVNHLDMQPLAPISNPSEMGSQIDTVLFRLRHSERYKGLFYSAFNDSSITTEQFLKSIAQFMLTLVSANSKYDKVTRKEPGISFTNQEENGYNLFKQNCASCHREPLFTTNDFASNGLPADTFLNDVGRMKITGDSVDFQRFKIPTLRNVEFSYPYMHDGRFKRLQEVLDHYTSDLTHSRSISPELKKPIVLTANEKVDLLAFLLTLTDKQFLFDTSFSFPRQIFMPRAKE